VYYYRFKINGVHSAVNNQWQTAVKNKKGFTLCGAIVKKIG
jgi:hypothetical protein